MFRRYLSVTKPGIIMGNLISVAGGFLLASRGDIDPWLMIATLIGLSLVVASGCAINNVIDRDIDVAMARTRTRVTVTGEMSAFAALSHGILLGVVGFGLLIAYTTQAAVFFAAFGYVIYVGVYSLYMKRNSVYGTFVGSLSGAVPPVVGYCAVTGQFDMGALILLVMFSLWQMPHSYAIAIFRFKDYQAAGIPVLPVAPPSAAVVCVVFSVASFGLSFFEAKANCFTALLVTLSGVSSVEVDLITMFISCIVSLLMLSCFEGCKSSTRQWYFKILTLCNSVVSATIATY